jgi:putative transposase
LPDPQPDLQTCVTIVLERAAQDVAGAAAVPVHKAKGDRALGDRWRPPLLIHHGSMGRGTSSAAASSTRSLRAAPALATASCSTPSSPRRRAELARVPASAGGGIVACDFFTVESVFLRRYYVLFFIAHANRRVWLAGCTKNPTGGWVIQQARNLGLDFADQGMRFMIRDRDSKYSGHFDVVFRSEGIRIVKTPVRAPKANAIAERFVKAVRAECLDWLLILNRRHLERVLRIYVDHYNRHRPHRALKLQPPQPGTPEPQPPVGEICRRELLGGLIHEYYRAAA